MMHGNRVHRGPAWASVPFTHINHEFWPSREKLKEEALAMRENEANRFRLPIPKTSGKTDVTLDFQYVHENTPVLAEFYDNFKEWFGETGWTHCMYFYLDGGADYEWHRDNILSDIKFNPKEILAKEGNSANHDLKTPAESSNFPVNCCINLVITEDGSECEFMDHGLYKYTAGILNTSHWHRVKPSTTRILARISFLEMIYEEVVHRIRKIERNKK